MRIVWVGTYVVTFYSLKQWLMYCNSLCKRTLYMYVMTRSCVGVCRSTIIELCADSVRRVYLCACNYLSCTRVYDIWRRSGPLYGTRHVCTKSYAFAVPIEDSRHWEMWCHTCAKSLKYQMIRLKRINSV